MLQLVLRRILATVPILFGVSLVAFLLMRLVPGDFTLTLLGPFATERRIAELREFYGLDQPLWVQYLKWLGNILAGEFGRSIAYRVPISGLLADRVANTLILTLASATFAIALGFLGGVWAAVRRYSLADRLITMSALVAASAPTFWFALLMLYLFSLELRWFPAVGMYTLGREGDLLDLLWHLPLPAIAASLISLAVILRMTRAGMLDQLGRDHIRAARARGLPERTIVLRHAVRSIIPPVVNISGLQIGFLFGSALFAEVIFQWPGIGLLLYNSILARDVPVIQAVLLVIAIVFVIANLVSDVTVVALNRPLRGRAR
jgi:peptide/nickel transport system permease protein